MIHSNELASSNTTSPAARLSDRAGQTADHALVAAKQAVRGAADSVESGLDGLRDTVPPTLTNATAQAQDMTRRSLDRARVAGSALRDSCARAGDRTVGYIRDEPVKSVMIAAAVGAAAALLVRWVNRDAG